MRTLAHDIGFTFIFNSGTTSAYSVMTVYLGFGNHMSLVFLNRVRDKVLDTLVSKIATSRSNLKTIILYHYFYHESGGLFFASNYFSLEKFVEEYPFVIHQTWQMPRKLSGISIPFFLAINFFILLFFCL